MNIDTFSKLGAGALAFGLLVSACSGGDSGSSVVAVNAEPASDQPPESGTAENDSPPETPEEAPSAASGEASQTESEPAPAEEPSEEPRGENQLPDVVMIDIASGDEVTLASFAPSDRPIVLWFWAPHWPTCRREAPEVEQFARDHADEVQVIGVGTQDNLDMARSFIDTYGTVSFPMLWDPTFESWIELGINGQPAGMLATADGTLVAQWRGGIPEEEVLQAVAEL